MLFAVRLMLAISLLALIAGCATQHYTQYYKAHKASVQEGEKTKTALANALAKALEHGSEAQKSAALTSLTWMAATHKIQAPEPPKAGPIEHGAGRFLEQGPWAIANWITGSFAGDRINIKSTNNGGSSVIGAKGNISSAFKQVDIGLNADNGSIIGDGSITDIVYTPITTTYGNDSP